MHITLIVLFTLFALTQILDPFLFHARRERSPSERWTRWVNPLYWCLAYLTAGFLPYSDSTKPLIYVLAVGLLGLTIKEELTLARDISRGERVFHAVGIFLSPLVFGLIAAIWPFVNGVSFFLGLVLPFGTDGLKPIMITFGALYLAWTVVCALVLARQGEEKREKDVSRAKTSEPSTSSAKAS